jgi:hypothetical protein
MEHLTLLQSLGSLGEEPSQIQPEQEGPEKGLMPMLCDRGRVGSGTGG